MYWCNGEHGGRPVGWICHWALSMTGLTESVHIGKFYYWMMLRFAWMTGRVRVCVCVRERERERERESACPSHHRGSTSPCTHHTLTPARHPYVPRAMPHYTHHPLHDATLTRHTLQEPSPNPQVLYLSPPLSSRKEINGMCSES